MANMSAALSEYKTVKEALKAALANLSTCSTISNNIGFSTPENQAKAQRLRKICGEAGDLLTALIESTEAKE